MAQSLVTDVPAIEEDFSRARRFMVDGQLAPNGITDPLLMGAMGELPREAAATARRCWPGWASRSPRSNPRLP
jgi:hypothetical protein